VQPTVDRRLAAILVADAAGYSRRMGEDEVGTLRALGAHLEQAFKPEIAAHRGRIVKSTGDGLLVEFASAVDAVAAAVAIQRAMAARNADIPADRRIEFRIGINIGDVIVEGADIYGDGVNLAARLEALAEPGGVCIAAAVHEQFQGKLPYAFADWGARSVKNIVHPVHVYGLGAAAIAALAEAPAGVPASPNRSRIGGPRRLWWAAALASVVVAALALGAWLVLVPHRAPVSPALAGRFSIVVLPFAALNSEPGQDYIADTLTEDLTTNLARLARGAVIAPSTAFTYKGKPVDVKQLRRELGVRYVLEGSEQHDHDRLRVDAQLIDATSGTNLWADQFDADRADLPQMQDQIVTELLRSLQFKVTDVEAARLAQTPPADLTAEELAMRCNARFVASMPGDKAREAAIDLCARALQIDPRNVRALTLLAEGTIDRVLEFQSTDRDADIRRADDLVSRALAVDRNAYGAHATKAEVLMAEKRFDEAIVEAEQALALNPSFVSAYTALSTANIFLGRPEKAVAYADTAMRLSPRDPQLFLFQFQKGLALVLLGRNDEAIEWLHRTLAAAPDWPMPHALLTAALAEEGRKPEAEAALKRYLSLTGGRNGTIARWVAQLPSDNPDFRSAVSRIIDGLRKAGMPEQ